MIYEFRLHEKQFPVAPQLAGETLEAMRIRNNGHLTPRAIVEESTPPDAPLHPVFEWDDAKAALEYRENQARDLVREIVVRLPEQKAEADPVRAFVAVRVEKEPVFTDVGTALSEPSMRAQLLESATRELFNIRKRYSQLVELADVFAKIDDLKETSNLR